MLGVLFVNVALALLRGASAPSSPDAPACQVGSNRSLLSTEAWRWERAAATAPGNHSFLGLGGCPLRCASEIDFVLILDLSGSVNGPMFVTQREFARDLAPAMTAGRSRMGVVAFASEAAVVSHLSADADALDKDLLALARPTGYESNAAMAISHAENLLMSGGRASAQSVILLVLSGMPVRAMAVEQLAGGYTQTGRLVIAACGSRMRLDKLGGWVSFPQEENLLSYPTLGGLDATKMVPELCPQLQGVTR